MEFIAGGSWLAKKWKGSAAGNKALLMLLTKPARLTGDPTADPGLAWCCHPRDGCRSPALLIEQGDPWIDVLQWSPGTPVILRSWMHLTR